MMTDTDNDRLIEVLRYQYLNNAQRNAQSVKTNLWCYMTLKRSFIYIEQFILEDIFNSAFYTPLSKFKHVFRPH